MHRHESISSNQQMYLKVLLQLSRTHPVGRVRDISQELGLTPGTVSIGLKRLEESGLVERERYGGVMLTDPGAAVARCVTRRYEVLKSVLTEILGVDPRTADLDACGMEHSVSPMTVNRMEALLTFLRAGQSIDMRKLAALHKTIDDRCTECAAAGDCRAVEMMQCGLD
jgi:DtxR family Mn-dependent transcriptional regulator